MKMQAGFLIRTAAPMERKMLMGHFPMLKDGPEAAVVFVAPDPLQKGPPMGLGILHSQEAGGTALVHVFVRPNQRRKGLGSALMCRAVEAATALGHSYLQPAKPIHPEDPLCAFVRQHGFESFAVISEFEADAHAMLDVVEPVYRRLVEKDKIPTGAELLPIERSPVAEVRALVLEHLPRLDQELAPDLRSYVGTASRALVLDGRLIGAVLARPLGALAYWDANVVAPDRRNTWASTHLKRALFAAVLASGAKQIRFRTNEAIHPDTAKLARRTNAALLDRVAHFGRPLAAGSVPPPG